MSIHSVVERSVPAWQGSGIEKRLNAISDFLLGVGGVQRGDRVAVVNVCDGRLLPTLQKSGVQALAVDGRRFSSSHTLPMPSGCTDVVFANMVLHHMRYPVQAITEMNRVLKSGGRLVLTDLGKYRDARFKDTHHDFWMGFYTSDIRHWLHLSGFSNIIVNPIPYKMLRVDMKSMANDGDAEIFLATGTVLKRINPWTRPIMPTPF